MSAFPEGGDIAATRAWLDNEGFNGLLVGWEADALLGADNSDFIDEIGVEKCRSLRGLLNTARQTPAQRKVLDLTAIGNALPTTRPTFKESKANKAPGSSFVASNSKAFSGFGMMSHRLFYDATDYEVELGGRSDNPILTPFSSSIEELNSFLKIYNLSVERASRTIRNVVMVYHDLGKVSETKSGKNSVGKNLTVQENHLNEIAKLFNWITSTKIPMELSSFAGCDVGLATARTIADGYILGNDSIVRGIVEVKNNTDTPAEILRQGLSEATNVAIMQLRRGVSWNNIMVPVVSSNGYLFQFAVVYLLYPSFPATMTISPVLDATDHKMLKEIASHPVCRKFVLFPLCIREYDDNMDKTEMLFPNLTHYGYQIGLPSDDIQRQSYLQQIRLALQAFHDAGVAHLDLYPSNFMWKAHGDNTVSIKVIDWDSAHFLDDTFCTDTAERLVDIRRRLKTAAARKNSLSTSSATAVERVYDYDGMTYYDISLFQVLERNINNPALQVSEKQYLDLAFTKLMFEYVLLP